MGLDVDFEQSHLRGESVFMCGVELFLGEELYCFSFIDEIGLRLGHGVLVAGESSLEVE